MKYHSQAFKISLQCFSQITDPDANFLLKGNLLVTQLDGKEGVVEYFTVHPGLGSSVEQVCVACCPGSSRDVTVRG